jgi:hypothetical protein
VVLDGEQVMDDDPYLRAQRAINLLVWLDVEYKVTMSSIYIGENPASLRGIPALSAPVIP